MEKRVEESGGGGGGTKFTYKAPPPPAPPPPPHLLDVQGVLHAELRGQPVEDGIGFRREGGHLHDLGYARELLQPAALHRHPEADETVLAEDATQALDLGGVPPADGPPV